MRKVVLKWDKLTVLEKIKKMRFVIGKMSANAVTFPSPNPTMLILAGLVQALEDAETATSEGGKDRTRARDNALDNATAAMILEVLYVQTVTLGDEDLTALAGMETQAVPQRWPEPDMPESLKVKPGKLEGSVYMFCKGTKYKKEYVFEMWVEPRLRPIDPIPAPGLGPTPGPSPSPDSGANFAVGFWQEIQTQSSGRYQHEGLERGKIYRFRVYAKNAAGRSTASSEASCAAR